MFAFALKRHDWFLNAALAVVAAASLIILASISRELFLLQALWFILGGAVIAVSSLFDWRPLTNYPWVILGFYAASVVLLVLNFICIGPALCLGPLIRGTRSWLVLGPLRFQTAEFAKTAFLILLAYFFAKRHVGIARPRTILKSFVYCIVPAVLVLKQPDMGSAMVFFGLWAGFLLVSGIRLRHALAGALLVAVVVAGGWNFLKSYQRERIAGFIRPSYDPLGINYNVNQSKIAIGSAGFLGKGFKQGTQVQLGFLPEPATDFVIAAFIEEWGLAGGAVVIGAFLMFLLRIVAIGLRAGNNFFRFICMGAVIMFLFQFLLNAGSALGMLPVVGVTFPFMSYGGSSLLTSAFLVGIIQSIAVRSRT